METLNGTQPDQTAHIPEMCQVDDKTEKRVRVRSGEGTAAYWRARLFRNSYRDRDGNTVEIPEYYVRMRREGLTKRVRLHTSDKDSAADEALRVSERLSREGWSAITDGQARLPSSPTIDEFCDLYRTATASMERSPRKISIATYTRSLCQLCALAGVKQIRDLNRGAIEKARDAYRAKARKQGRLDSAIQNTISKVLRNAGACFATEARAIMQRQGINVENPFAGMKRTQEIQPVASLPADVIARIWADLPQLRDGNPDAAVTDVGAFRKHYQKRQGRKARWLPVDFRRPHPHAAACVLLALGAGLRRNECDKARWSWLKFDGKGDCFIQIGEESDFKPKGGTLRLIKIPREMHDALVRTRTDLFSPYVLGGQESPKKTASGEGYRRPETFRAVNQWLRNRGVVGKNPLHRMRKQFGSELATEFGLFAAQKLLGHSSPTVTAKYYAAQTELPTLSHIKIMG